MAHRLVCRESAPTRGSRTSLLGRLATLEQESAKMHPSSIQGDSHGQSVGRLINGPSVGRRIPSPLLVPTPSRYLTNDLFSFH
jgi:hypothetical protein